MAFDVGERLAEQRLITKVFAPVGRQGFDAVGERFAGEVGAARGLADQKADVVDDEIAAARTDQAVPADPGLAVLEMISARRPLDHRDGFSALADDVEEAVPTGLKLPRKCSASSQPAAAVFSSGDPGTHQTGSLQSAAPIVKVIRRIRILRPPFVRFVGFKSGR
jgi:hypothetical protein